MLEDGVVGKGKSKRDPSAPVDEPEEENAGIANPEDEPSDAVSIHVYDDARGLSRDFECGRSVLVSSMGYFSAYLSGASDGDVIDIAVHCDVVVFEWLMCWIKGLPPPTALSPSNSPSLLISSDFLGIPGLVDHVSRYIASHLDDVSRLPLDLSCLGDQLVGGISQWVDGVECLECMAGDRRDRLRSRLYKFLAARELNDDTYAGSVVLMGCDICGRIVSDRESQSCTRSPASIDYHGSLHTPHRLSQRSFSLPLHLVSLVSRGLPWTEVYWHLWGLLNHLECLECKKVFKCTDYAQCSYHPKGVVNGRYECCGREKPLFDTAEGCSFRRHRPLVREGGNDNSNKSDGERGESNGRKKGNALFEGGDRLRIERMLRHEASVVLPPGFDPLDHDTGDTGGGGAMSIVMSALSALSLEMTGVPSPGLPESVRVATKRYHALARDRGAENSNKTAAAAGSRPGSRGGATNSNNNNNNNNNNSNGGYPVSKNSSSKWSGQESDGSSGGVFEDGSSGSYYSDGSYSAYGDSSSESDLGVTARDPFGRRGPRGSTSALGSFPTTSSSSSYALTSAGSHRSRSLGSDLLLERGNGNSNSNSGNGETAHQQLLRQLHQQHSVAVMAGLDVRSRRLSNRIKDQVRRDDIMRMASMEEYLLSLRKGSKGKEAKSKPSNRIPRVSSERLGTGTALISALTGVPATHSARAQSARRSTTARVLRSASSGGRMSSISSMGRPLSSTAASRR